LIISKKQEEIYQIENNAKDTILSVKMIEENKSEL
jgi:hypothetical protein